MELVRENILLVWNVITYGNELMFGDDEDDEEHTTILEKVQHFAEETVPRFSNRQFKENFRMCPETFEDFLRKLHSVKRREMHVGHPELSLDKQAMITVWCLANMKSFRSVAGRFGISKSTCWSVLYRTCLYILEINRIHKIVWWPSRERALNIIQNFEAINGFPGVTGCIDGSHIKILPPKHHPNSYYNRKKFHSVLLQGVCDHRKLFTDIYPGQPGSMHDSRLLEKSDLQEAINQGSVDFPNNSHLIGDLAYKLCPTLLVGFKNNNFLTDRQKNFNFRLSQIRVTIENAFALLKGRFRRLKYMETVRLDLICIRITSACILHNICILNGDSPNDIMDIEEELAEEQQQNAGMQEDREDMKVNNRNANVKRNNIVNSLRMTRNL